MTDLSKLATQFAILKEQKEYLEKKAKAIQSLMDNLGEELHGAFVNDNSLKTTIGGECFRDGKARNISPLLDPKPSIKKTHQTQVAAWLEAIGQRDLLTLSFKFQELPEDVKDKLAKFTRALREEEEGLKNKIHFSVHPATLKSFVKERKAKGEPLPDGISVFEVKTAKVTRVSSSAKKGAKK